MAEATKKKVASAIAKLSVQRIADRLRIEVEPVGISPESVPVIRDLVDALNGRPFDTISADSPAFSRPIRLESVGFDDDGRVESFAIEADMTGATGVVLAVDNEHMRRAAAFCQQHRHTTTTEAMDYLAAEFERVARGARADAFRATRSWCVDQIHAAKEGSGRDD